MLTKLKAIFITTLSVLSMASGADYLVPYGYDNMLQSVNSQGYGVITNSSALGTATYNIGGSNVQYRCLTIPKISCRSATAYLYANVSELVLTKPDAVVANQKAMTAYISDIRSEDAGTNWRLCGGAVGGEMYDGVTTSAGNIVYTPNQYSNVYPYFTSLANISTTSYMAVTYNQVCQ